MSRRRLVLAVVGLTALGVAAVAAFAGMRALPRDPDPLEKAIAAGWAGAAPEAATWTRQDQTQRECTAHGNRPPDRDAVFIMEREWRTIVYPDDGEVFGEWRRGAELARVSSKGAEDRADGGIATGGQCSTCHRLEPRDVVPVQPGWPTTGANLVGPDLIGYGRVRSFAWTEHKLLYEQIFNSNAVTACSVMPRFGTHKVLSPEQIRDIVAYLMSPQSPVNAEADTRR